MRISGCRVGRRMVEGRVGIDTAVPAPQRVAQLDIAQRAAAGSAARKHVFAAADALDRDLRALAAVGRRIDRDRIRHLRRALWRVLPYAAAAGVEAAIDERRQRSVVLIHRHLDDAVVHGPRTAVIDNRHRGVGGRTVPVRPTCGRQASASHTDEETAESATTGRRAETFS